MSCTKGQPCREGLRRRASLGVLGLMGVIFIGLSAASFVDSRGQVVPQAVTYDGYDAVAGKRVLQAYNCMDCHTVVGNGGYFAPDLTKLYAKVGPAWLEAFLPSAGAWPTEGAVKLQLQNKAVAAEAGVDGIEAYLEKYPGAAERIQRRGGQATLMPNLPFSHDEVGELIAFLKYTAEMNTEGWPPAPEVNGLDFPEARPMPVAAREAQAAPPEVAPAKASAGADSAVARGEQLAKDSGCTACHAPTDQKLVGPGWGGLYGAAVTLADGSGVTADDAYLTESILDPNAKVVEGFGPGIMPAYAGVLDADQVEDIVAYIRSLEGNRP